MKYVILIVSSEQKAEIIGNDKGEPLSLREGEQLARRYIKARPELNILLMPITPLSIDNVPL